MILSNIVCNIIFTRKLQFSLLYRYTKRNIVKIRNEHMTVLTCSCGGIHIFLACVGKWKAIKKHIFPFVCSSVLYGYTFSFPLCAYIFIAFGKLWRFQCVGSVAITFSYFHSMFWFFIFICFSNFLFMFIFSLLFVCVGYNNNNNITFRW